MNIYLAHSSKFDYLTGFYRPLQNSQIHHDHKINYYLENNPNPGSTEQIIKNSDLVIAEVSFPSLSEGIELGWAKAYQVPIICVHKPNQIASKYLNVITDQIYPYSSLEELIIVIQTGIEIA